MQLISTYIRATDVHNDEKNTWFVVWCLTPTEVSSTLHIIIVRIQSKSVLFIHLCCIQSNMIQSKLSIYSSFFSIIRSKLKPCLKQESYGEACVLVLLSWTKSLSICHPSGMPSLSVTQYSCSNPIHGSSCTSSGRFRNSANGLRVLITKNK